jgi:hypothetical protein
LLAVACCCLLLLAVACCCSLSLAVACCCLLLLAVARCRLLLLAVSCCSLMLLAVACQQSFLSQGAAEIMNILNAEDKGMFLLRVCAHHVRARLLLALFLISLFLQHVCGNTCFLALALAVRAPHLPLPDTVATPQDRSFQPGFNQTLLGGIGATSGLIYATYTGHPLVRMTTQLVTFLIRPLRVIVRCAVCVCVSSFPSSFVRLLCPFSFVLSFS